MGMSCTHERRAGRARTATARIGSALAIGLVAAVGAGCGSTPSQPSAPSVPIQPSVPPAPIPAPIAWGQCAADGYGGERFPAGAECGTLEVPVDYAKPDGATAQLALIRFKATGDKIGSLIVNPGGPGASGVQFGADDEEYLTPPLLERFDRIGFDPRGVGTSTPAIDCDSDADIDRDRADSDVVVTAADAQRETEENRQFVQRCIDKTGVEFLANVGTVNVAKDLDQLRVALGDEKLTYLGYSYGTAIGTAYAEAFPANVRAMVLDGAIDPTAVAVNSQYDESSDVSQAAGFQSVFNSYAADCARKPRCPLGPDPAKAVEVFRSLVDPLMAKPALTDDPRGLTFHDAEVGAYDALYDDDDWPDLTKGLRALADGGKPNELLAFADEYLERDEDGHYSNVSDAYTATYCVDYPFPKDPAAYVDIERRLREAQPASAYGSFTGNAAVDRCAFWPVPPTTTPHTASAPGLPKVLVISTTDDPATPYQQGVDLAKQLGAALLTFEGSQHTASFYGDKCVDDITTNYLIDVTLPPENTRC